MSDINLDSLLDSTLDDLNDLPSFKPFPAGAHKLLATLEIKEINNKPAVELGFKYVEPIEFANPEDQAAHDAGTGVKAGDTSNTMFILDNEFGQGKLKQCAIPLGEALGTGVLREIIEQTNDMEVIAVTGQRVDKNDKDKVYLVVKELAVV